MGADEEGTPNGSARGHPTSIIAFDAFDLYEVVDRQLDLADVIRAKARRAAETNRCHVPVRELF